MPSWRSRHDLKKAPSLARLKSCAECHAADGSVPSDDPEFNRLQGTTFLFSRCFTASKERFGCTTCHDPHSSVATSTSHYEGQMPELSWNSPHSRPADPASSGPGDEKALATHRSHMSCERNRQVHLVPHAEGRGSVAALAFHRPSHPRPSRSWSGSCGRERSAPNHDVAQLARDGRHYCRRRENQP